MRVWVDKGDTLLQEFLQQVPLSRKAAELFAGGAPLPALCAPTDVLPQPVHTALLAQSLPEAVGPVRRYPKCPASESICRLAGRPWLNQDPSLR